MQYPYKIFQNKAVVHAGFVEAKSMEEASNAVVKMKNLKMKQKGFFRCWHLGENSVSLAIFAPPQ